VRVVTRPDSARCKVLEIDLVRERDVSQLLRERIAAFELEIQDSRGELRRAQDDSTVLAAEIESERLRCQGMADANDKLSALLSRLTVLFSASATNSLQSSIELQRSEDEKRAQEAERNLSDACELVETQTAAMAEILRYLFTLDVYGYSESISIGNSAREAAETLILASVSSRATESLSQSISMLRMSFDGAKDDRRMVSEAIKVANVQSTLTQSFGRRQLVASTGFSRLSNLSSETSQRGSTSMLCKKTRFCGEL
jgi:hypothetical protein